MSASDHLQHEQLRMFMTGTEVKNYVNASVDVEDDGTTMDEMWARKLDESKRPLWDYEHGAGVYNSLARHGVLPSGDPRRPAGLHNDDDDFINVIHDAGGMRQMGEGHHRVAASADIEQRTGRQIYWPIEHSEIV